MLCCVQKDLETGAGLLTLLGRHPGKHYLAHPGIERQVVLPTVAKRERQVSQFIQGKMMQRGEERDDLYNQPLRNLLTRHTFKHFFVKRLTRESGVPHEGLASLTCVHIDILRIGNRQRNTSLKCLQQGHLSLHSLNLAQIARYAKDQFVIDRDQIMSAGLLELVRFHLWIARRERFSKEIQGIALAWC